MKGDFTRNTFDPNKHFLRVLMQQGRVQLDADWNEQTAILLHYLQTLAADIIGPYAGPASELGFEIKPGDAQGDFKIGEGRYYVNGLLCENGQETGYLNQTDYPLSKEDDALGVGNYVVYLDVWERHVCYVEDDSIREKALNGADTATRSKVVWQVKVKPITYNYAYCQQGTSLLGEEVSTLSRIGMSARAKQVRKDKQPCLTEPDAQYRGLENQLYRVEIHDGNTVDEAGNAKTPTFKFSRENGSAIFPVSQFVYDAGSNTSTASLEHLGRDEKLGLKVHDWVELIDDRISLKNEINPLLQVLDIDVIDRKIILSGGEGMAIHQCRHPLLRRWDQRAKKNEINAEGVIEIHGNGWIPLEDGIEVKFALEDGGAIRPGDYWLIPARVATGDIEWPSTGHDKNTRIPQILPPQGIEHHYAPLAIIAATDGTVTVTSDCRCSFEPLSGACNYNYFGRIGIGTDLIRPRARDDR